ncbi:hypothetical protein V5N11_022252 [Cardamine amara subsp. amara]|uniref:CG-1 domain-containing protein n=1 Tax=Cardamine amara subsp. amara TaxID=228776 RepID=A0ABD1C314_CARAN
MACNLQEEIDLDLDELFERSIHDWLGFEDIHEIFHKREDLVVSNEPVQFPEEGLFLFNTMTYMEDSIQWRVTKSKRLTENNAGEDDIRYKIDQCHLIPMEDGVTSTYERRVYKCENLYGAARLVHYRSYHLSDNSEEIETGEDTEDSQNPNDDDGDNTETSDGEDDDTDTDTDNEDDDSDSGGDDNQDVEVVVPVANGVC